MSTLRVPLRTLLQHRIESQPLPKAPPPDLVRAAREAKEYLEKVGAEFKSAHLFAARIQHALDEMEGGE